MSDKLNFDKQKTLDEFRSIDAEEIVPLLEKGPITLQNRLEGKAYGVLSADLVKTSEDVAWNILLDYPNYPRFINAVKSTRVKSHEGNETVVKFEAGVKVMGVGGMIKYIYKIREERPFLNIFNMTTGEPVGFWSVFPVKDSDSIVLCHASVSRNVLELSNILKFLVEKIPSAELGLRISPAVMMVSDMKKQMEKQV